MNTLHICLQPVQAKKGDPKKVILPTTPAGTASGSIHQRQHPPTKSISLVQTHIKRNTTEKKN